MILKEVFKTVKVHEEEPSKSTFTLQITTEFVSLKLKPQFEEKVIYLTLYQHEI